MTPADFTASLRELIAVALQTGPKSEATERSVRELGSVFADLSAAIADKGHGHFEQWDICQWSRNGLLVNCGVRSCVWVRCGGKEPQ